MSEKFEQISLKPGFMKHNGGVMFRNISNNEYEFKSIINENHLNAAGITHGGYLSALVDAGAGTAAHRSADNAPCVTISLDLKFIGASKVGDEIITNTDIQNEKKYLIFLRPELNNLSEEPIIKVSENSLIKSLIKKMKNFLKALIEKDCFLKILPAQSMEQ